MESDICPTDIVFVSMIVDTLATAVSYSAAHLTEAASAAPVAADTTLSVRPIVSSVFPADASLPESCSNLAFAAASEALSISVPRFWSCAAVVLVSTLAFSSWPCHFSTRLPAFS